MPYKNLLLRLQNFSDIVETKYQLEVLIMKLMP